MVHLRPVILALLFALAAPVAASVGVTSTQPALSTPPADVQVYAPEGTSSAMTLGEGVEETRAFAQPTVDLGTTLASETDLMEGEIVSHSFETRFSKATTRDEKRDILLQYITAVDKLTTQLEKRERVASRGFRNGSISPQQYLHTLARIDAQASRLFSTTEKVNVFSSQVSGFSLTGTVGLLQKRLMSLEGPIRNRVGQSISGNHPVGQIYVSAAENGIVLSTIVDGTYEREYYRTDFRSVDAEGAIDASGAETIMNQTYSWAFASRGSESWEGKNWRGYHTYEVGYSHGHITAFIDTSNGAVFKDFQRKDLTFASAQRNGREMTLSPGPGTATNESGLILTANRSYPGGPMYISLTNETGSPVEGTIIVDGDERGQTTTDGGLWTLSPAGSFNVTATVGLDEVTVETRAMRPITRQTNSSEV